MASMAFLDLLCDGHPLLVKRQDQEVNQSLLRQMKVPKPLDFQEYCQQEVEAGSTKSVQELLADFKKRQQLVVISVGDEGSNFSQLTPESKTVSWTRTHCQITPQCSYHGFFNASHPQDKKPR